MECIPSEICTQILYCLPPKSLIRFRTVSKFWQSIIDSPDFASLHLCHYTNNQPESHIIVLERPVGYNDRESRAKLYSRRTTAEHYVETSEFDFQVPPLVLKGFTEQTIIAGHVNGVLLVQRKREELSQGDIFLWNPSIQKRLDIPFPPSRPQFRDLCFGFDPSTSDYKVVNMVPVHRDEGSTITLDIFSLNSRSWRRESCSGGEVGHILSSDDNKVSLGESVHWVGHDEYLGFQLYKGFVSFNMTCETFSHTPLPEVSNEHDIGRINVPVAVLGSMIGLLTSCYGVTDIWVLDEVGCWGKKFTIDTEIGYVADQRIYLDKYGVLIWEADSVDDTIICASDINTGKKNVVSQCRRWWPFYFGAYIESLVLLS